LLEKIIKASTLPITTGLLAFIRGFSFFFVLLKNIDLVTEGNTVILLQ